MTDTQVLQGSQGLPASHELAPLNQPLISPTLASAFGIPFAGLSGSHGDSMRLAYLPAAAQNSLLRTFPGMSSSTGADAAQGDGAGQSKPPQQRQQQSQLPGFVSGIGGSQGPAVSQEWVFSLQGSPQRTSGHGQLPATGLSGQPNENAPPSTLPQPLRQRSSEELHQAAPAGGGGHPANNATGMPQNTGLGQPSSSDAAGDQDEFAKAVKRPRLVWTPQLHQRFVDAVKQLGVKSAVPKTIMQLMSVDGLTRENVASHLQKYRLQLRRSGEDEPAGPPNPVACPTSQGEGAQSLEAQSPPAVRSAPAMEPLTAVQLQQAAAQLQAMSPAEAAAFMAAGNPHAGHRH